MTTLYHCLQGDEVFSSPHNRWDVYSLLQDFLKLFQHKNYAEITLEDTSGEQVMYIKLADNKYVGCSVGVTDYQLCSPVCVVFDAANIDIKPQCYKPQYYQSYSTVGTEPTLAAKLIQRVIKLLANHKDSGTRVAVAKNFYTPAAVLEQLATDEDSDVRWWAALTRTVWNFGKKC